MLKFLDLFSKRGFFEASDFFFLSSFSPGKGATLDLAGVFLG
jgi:hypothetical protein